jgi:hypothetical protein
VCPLLLPTCLYCFYCLLFSFSFFPWWRSVCPGGYAALAQGCLWEYHGTVKHTLSMSFQAVWAWVAGGPGALLVSPFNLKWRCSVLAGGVEWSEFCLFSVTLPAKCVSSISPRFHYRRLTFCFLPLLSSWNPPFFLLIKSFLTFMYRLWWNVNYIPETLYHFAFPFAKQECFIVPHPSQHLVLSGFYFVSSECVPISHCDFICIFLRSRDMEDHFMC